MKITTQWGTYPTYPISKSKTPMVGAVFRPSRAFKSDRLKDLYGNDLLPHKSKIRASVFFYGLNFYIYGALKQGAINK